MSYRKGTTTQRVTAATVALGLAGTGLLANGFGNGVSTVTAAKTGRPGVHAGVEANNGPAGAALGFPSGKGTLHAFGKWLGAKREQAADALAAAVNGVDLAVTNISDGATGDGANQPSGSTYTWRVPHSITVTAPSVEGGREPSITRGNVDPGTAPSYEVGSDHATIHLGTAPSAQAPTVDDPGEMPTINPPHVEVD